MRAILADREEEFAVRAVTRHPDGEAARELERLGVDDIVRADMDDPPSLAPDARPHAGSGHRVRRIQPRGGANRHQEESATPSSSPSSLRVTAPERASVRSA
ncbi:hypothetical protein ACIRSU_02415 [Streptomyces sp. NPDC101160]|uniref:hypothetical protein n=1 Tax=Streptomyces sp. NPDC101160 TaxID=3366118 RepID=UPI003805A5A7